MADLITAEQAAALAGADPFDDLAEQVSDFIRYKATNRNRSCRWLLTDEELPHRRRLCELLLRLGFSAEVAATDSDSRLLRIQW